MSRTATMRCATHGLPVSGVLGKCSACYPPIAIEHNSKKYVSDEQGTAQVVYLEDRCNERVSGGVDYKFELSGAHQGEPIQIWVTNIRDDWDETGLHASWSQFLWADDETEFRDDYLLDSYTDELRDHLNQIVSEWE